MRLIVILLMCLSIQFCSEKQILPEKILDYHLTQKVTGIEAQKIVNKIHLNPVTDIENEIGYYQNGDDKAIIYITYYSSDDDAQADLIKMVDKISPQNSIFLNGGQVEINKITAYRYFGMGQTHFIFRVDNIMIWLSVDTMIAKEFLESYLQKIN